MTDHRHGMSSLFSHSLSLSLSLSHSLSLSLSLSISLSLSLSACYFFHQKIYTHFLSLSLSLSLSPSLCLSLHVVCIEQYIPRAIHTSHPHSFHTPKDPQVQTCRHADIMQTSCRHPAGIHTCTRAPMVLSCSPPSLTVRKG